MSQFPPLVSMVTATLPPDAKNEDYLTFDISIIIEEPIVVQSPIRILFVYDSSIPLPLLLRKLETCRSDVRKNKSKELYQQLASLPEGSNLPTLVYKFDLEFSQKYLSPTIRASIIPVSNALPLGGDSKPNLSIAYEWIQVFDPETQSCLITFESNWAVQFVELHRFQELAIIGETMWNIRPTCRARFEARLFLPKRFSVRAKVIPSSIALCIGEYLMGDLQEKWRKPLLNFGLVSKSTSCVLCLFFKVQREEHQINDRADRPHLLRSVRSLWWKPERAHQISFLYPQFYSDFSGVREDGRHLRYYKAFFLLISLAKRVKHIILPRTIPKDVYPELILALTSIQEVESLNEERSLFPQEWVFQPQDIFQLLSQWPHLHALTACVYSDEETKIDSAQGENEPGASYNVDIDGEWDRNKFGASCNLETLKLTGSKLDKAHLLRFLPCEGTPRLRSLKLSDVEGIENNVLRKFLLAAAQTLEAIEIISSPVTASTDVENDQTLAFDDAMPYLTALKTLSIRESGTLVGVQCICARGNRIPRSYFSVMNADPFRGDDVLTALKSSSWDTVILYWDSPDLHQEGINIAQSENITFRPKVQDTGNMGFLEGFFRPLPFRVNAEFRQFF